MNKQEIRRALTAAKVCVTYGEDCPPNCPFYEFAECSNIICKAIDQVMEGLGNDPPWKTGQSFRPGATPRTRGWIFILGKQRLFRFMDMKNLIPGSM